MAPAARHFLPEPTSYEAEWWIRKVRFDGEFQGHVFDRQDALDSATEYAKKVSIGNLTILRNFITVSMKKSLQPYNYFETFRDGMLNEKGKEAFDRKRVYVARTDRFHLNSKQLEIAIKIMLGISRKRDLLVPEWADDTVLWTRGDEPVADQRLAL